MYLFAESAEDGKLEKGRVSGGSAEIPNLIKGAPLQGADKNCCAAKSFDQRDI
jgi:hypothetical protein